jgi:RNA polymerase sigma-70 factor (ECF subfamily)
MKEPDLEIFRNWNVSRQMNWIVKNYSKDLYWVIRPIVKTHENADDVLQNTMIKIYNNLPAFKYNSKLFSWMYRIAVNESLNFIKKNNKNKMGEELNEELISSLKSDPFYEGDEIMLKLEKALLTLPPRQQEIFRLKYFNDFTFEEIAQILGVSQGSLKASYHLAVKKIKNILNLSA